MHNINLNSVFNFITQSSEWPIILEEALNGYSNKEWFFGNDNFNIVAHIEILPTHDGDMLVETANTSCYTTTTPDNQKRDVIISIHYDGTYYNNQYSMSNFLSLCEWRENYQPLDMFAKNLRKKLLDVIEEQLKKVVLEKMRKPTNIIYGFINANCLIVDPYSISDIGAMPQHYPNARPAVIEFYDNLDPERILSENISVCVSGHENRIRIKNKYNTSILDESQKMPYVLKEPISY